MMQSHVTRRFAGLSFSISCAALAVAALTPANASATAIADVSAGELFGYVKIYQFSPTAGQDWSTTNYYTTDSSGMSLPSGFSRIGYYLELQAGAAPRQWVWASMDAFTTQLNKIGVPSLPSGAFYQQLLSDMNVQTNVGTITPGTGIATGNIEFWPTNFGPTNTLPVPGASGTVYDFGDQPSPGTHGSMQIHNYGAGQVLFGYNAWNGGAGGIGIGNDPVAPGGHTDWTFAANTYTLRNFEIWVLNDAALVPEPSSLALLGLGMVGMALKKRRRRLAAGG